MSIRPMLGTRRAKPNVLFYHEQAPLKRISKRSYLFNISMFFATLLLLCVSMVNAKFYVPQSEESFYRELKRHELAIVHFNPFAEDEVPQDIEDDLNDMKEAFFSLSKTERYKQADLAFIGVNTTVLPQLAADFKLSADEVATFILFKKGKEFKQDNEVVELNGIQTKKELRDFIETNFGNYIDKQLEKLAQESRERAQERPDVEVVNRRVYVDEAYPRRYYYSSPVYYGGYGYPYRRWGWGPGLGFGFGGRRFGIGFGFGW